MGNKDRLVLPDSGDPDEKLLGVVAGINILCVVVLCFIRFN